MISYITVKPSGQICSSGYVQKSVIDSIYIPEGARVIKGVSVGDPSMFYWDGEAIQEIPESPSTEHVFSYVTKEWVPSEAAIRRKRNALLSASDWTQVPDIPESTRVLWQKYRQALRDIPNQDGFPNSIVWPIAPN